MEERKRDKVPSSGAGGGSVWKSKLQAIKDLVMTKYITSTVVSISDRRAAVVSTKENQVTPVSEMSARNHKEQYGVLGRRMHSVEHAEEDTHDLESGDRMMGNVQHRLGVPNNRVLHSPLDSARL